MNTRYLACVSRKPGCANLATTVTLNFASLLVVVDTNIEHEIKISRSVYFFISPRLFDLFVSDYKKIIAKVLHTASGG